MGEVLKFVTPDEVSEKNAIKFLRFWQKIINILRPF